MAPQTLSFRFVCRKHFFAVFGVLVLAFMSFPSASHGPGLKRYRTLVGFVEGNGVEQSGFLVSLYASKANEGQFEKRILLGTDITDDSGRFEIGFKRPFDGRRRQKSLFYVVAERDKAMLGSAIGDSAQNDRVVVNELTTVAMATAFAQFIDGDRIYGNTYGILNAVRMAANMADPRTGIVGNVLIRSPNGNETSTYRTFNTISNIVSSCIDNVINCEVLFGATAPSGGPKPTTVLQAVANMAKYPSNNVLDLFNLADLAPTFEPRLHTEPNSWLLFIKFTGGFYSHYPESVASTPSVYA